MIRFIKLWEECLSCSNFEPRDFDTTKTRRGVFDETVSEKAILHTCAHFQVCKDIQGKKELGGE